MDLAMRGAMQYIATELLEDIKEIESVLDFTCDDDDVEPICEGCGFAEDICDCQTEDWH